MPIMAKKKEAGSVVEWIRKQLADLPWSSIVTSLASTSFVTTLMSHIQQMPLGILLFLGGSLFLAVLFGFISIKQIITAARKTPTDPAIKLENRRRKVSRQHFQKLVDEAKNGQNWDQAQLDSWVYKVTCAMRFLLPDDQIMRFSKLPPDGKLSSVDEQKECFLVQLEGLRIFCHTH
jgi:hypothetical protein